MNTIFWLSVFVSVCCYGRFIVQLLGLFAARAGYGSPRQQLVVKSLGILHFLEFRWIVFGAAATIVAVTV